MTAPAGPPTGPRDGGHGDWDPLAVGWALSTLDAEDEAGFAAHLPGCDRCAATVRESLHTVADLAYALPDEPPPPALRERIMTAVRAEPRRSGTAVSRAGSAGPPADPPAPAFSDNGEWPLAGGVDAADTEWFARPGTSTPPDAEAGSPQPDPGAPPAGRELAAPDSAGAELAAPHAAGVGSAAPTAGGVGPTDPTGVARDDPGGDSARPDRPRTDRGRHAAPDDGDDTVVPFARPARRWTRVAAAAAAVILLAALGAWNLRLRADQDDLREVVAQRDALVAQRDATIRQLTANGPARIAALVNPTAPTQARRATVVVRGNQVEIITETLGANTGNTTYWLWTLRCDTPQPSDLRPIQGFTLSQAQFSVRDIGSEPAVANATCFAISEEIGTARPSAPREVVAVGQPE